MIGVRPSSVNIIALRVRNNRECLSTETFMISSVGYNT